MLQGGGRRDDDDEEEEDFWFNIKTLKTSEEQLRFLILRQVVSKGVLVAGAEIELSPSICEGDTVFLFERERRFDDKWGFPEWAGNGEVIFSAFTATLGETRRRQNNPPPRLPRMKYS